MSSRQWLTPPVNAPRSLLLRATGTLAVAVLASGLCSCRPQRPPASPPVVVRFQTARLATPTLATPRAQYVGILRGDGETDLSFRVAGTLERIGPANDSEGWREGVAITNGQLLAWLNQSDFDSAVADARAWTNVYDNAFRRTELLFQQRTVSSEEMDRALAHRDSAQAALRKAQQAWADSRLLAPTNGYILARLANAGETILPGRTVLRVADLRTLSLEIGVPDTLVNRLRPGQQHPVEVSSFAGQPFVGTVSEVGVAAQSGSRLFKVVLKLPNDDPERRLRAGLSATVDFGGGPTPPPGSVAVPLSALLTGTRGGPQSLAVFVLDASGLARERAVETGDIVRSSVLVTRGLQPGDRVVTFGAALLSDGMVVTALPDGAAEGQP